MIMEYPVKAACLTSVGKPGTMLEGVVTVNFCVDYDLFTLARYAGHFFTAFWAIT